MSDSSVTGETMTVESSFSLLAQSAIQTVGTVTLLWHHCRRHTSQASVIIAQAEAVLYSAPQRAQGAYQILEVHADKTYKQGPRHIPTGTQTRSSIQL